MWLPGPLPTYFFLGQSLVRSYKFRKISKYSEIQVKYTANQLLFWYTLAYLFHVLVISNYCSSAPNATISNSLVSSNYSTSITSIVALNCTLGYQANGSMVATCTAFNASVGQWDGPSGSCTSMFINNHIKSEFYQGF